MYRTLFLLIILYSCQRVHAMDGVEKVALPGQLNEEETLCIKNNLEQFSVVELDMLLDNLRPTVLQDPDMKSAHETFGDVGILALTDMMNEEKEKIAEVCKKREVLQGCFEALLRDRTSEATIGRYATKICDYYWDQMSTLVNKKIYNMLERTISKNYIDLIAYLRALKKISAEDADAKLYFLDDVYKEREKNYTAWREHALQERTENILKQEQERFTRKVQSTTCQPEFLEKEYNKLSMYYTKFLQHVHNPGVEKHIKHHILKNSYDVAYWFYVHSDAVKALSYTYVGLKLSQHWEHINAATESNLQRFKDMLEGVPTYAKKMVNTARWPFKKRGMRLERVSDKKKVRFSEIEQEKNQQT